MPSNRRTQPEAEKRGQLVAAARALFVRDGYDATPMSLIARTAQVTPNTIYWYFRDKEQLLIAVLEEIQQEFLADHSSVARAPLVDQLLWLVRRKRQISGLVATVHHRIRESPELDQWHERFHALFEERFAAQLPGALPRAQRAAEGRIVAYAIEGMLAHDLAPAATRQLCAALAVHLESCAAPSLTESVTKSKGKRQTS